MSVHWIYDGNCAWKIKFDASFVLPVNTLTLSHIVHANLRSLPQTIEIHGNWRWWLPSYWCFFFCFSVLVESDARLVTQTKYLQQKQMKTTPAWIQMSRKSIYLDNNFIYNRVSTRSRVEKIVETTSLLIQLQQQQQHKSFKKANFHRFYFRAQCNGSVSFKFGRITDFISIFGSIHLCKNISYTVEMIIDFWYQQGCHRYHHSYVLLLLLFMQFPINPMKKW